MKLNNRKIITIEKTYTFDKNDIVLALLHFKKVKNVDTLKVKLEFKKFGITMFLDKKEKVNDFIFEIPFDKSEVLDCLTKFFKIELATITGHVDVFEFDVENESIELIFTTYEK